MERKVFDQMAKLDSSHWWFTARRRILDAIIERVVRPPANARILELGAGTGHNLSMLTRFGTVEASELDDVARKLASERLGRPVLEAALPDLSMFPESSYDLIALLDVLEHVEEDRASLAALRARLADGGRILLTVPAVPWLWSDHDVLHHHKRRYTLAGLRAVAQDAGLKVEGIGYFNSLLFPLAVATRTAHRLLGRKGGLDAQPSPPVNGVLRRIFGWERHLLGRVRFPIGLSLYAILSA